MCAVEAQYTTDVFIVNYFGSKLTTRCSISEICACVPFACHSGIARCVYDKSYGCYDEMEMICITGKHVRGCCCNHKKTSLDMTVDTIVGEAILSSIEIHHKNCHDAKRWGHLTCKAPCYSGSVNGLPKANPRNSEIVWSSNKTNKQLSSHDHIHNNISPHLFSA